VWRALEAALEADISTLYGDAFVESLSSRPVSAFIADGSPVVVRRRSDFSETEPNPSAPGNGVITLRPQSGGARPVLPEQ